MKEKTPMAHTRSHIQVLCDQLEQEITPWPRAQTFEAGDLVVDRHELPLWGSDAIEAAAVVLYRRVPDAKQAGVVTEEGPTTVACLNPEYPADDAVYRIAKVSRLDCDVPGWRRWNAKNARDQGEGFKRELHTYQTEQSVAITTHDYPASRLYPAGRLTLPQPHEDDERAIAEAMEERPYLQPRGERYGARVSQHPDGRRSRRQSG